jgi:Cu(I)/Ag(I) efflux system membrane protein CusA/SilA
VIARLIRWSIVNRFLVLLATLMISAWGVYSLLRTPLDALPDLSDVQVIIRTTYPGQAPRIVENQITYPLTTTMLSVPGAKTVRGYSFFGDSFVYVLFEDGTDLYWARSRVLEYLNQVQSRLPAAAKAFAGAGRHGGGLDLPVRAVDRTARWTRASCAPCRTGSSSTNSRPCPTWPKSPPWAAWCGSTRSCSTRTSSPPTRSRTPRWSRRSRRANQESGGSVLELGEAEYMVRASGYLQSLDDFRTDAHS